MECYLNFGKKSKIKSKGISESWLNTELNCRKADQQNVSSSKLYRTLEGNTIIAYCVFLQ